MKRKSEKGYIIIIGVYAPEERKEEEEITSFLSNYTKITRKIQQEL